MEIVVFGEVKLSTGVTARVAASNLSQKTAMARKHLSVHKK